MTRRSNEKERGRTRKELIGWREWLSLPDLGIAHIKAKIDTGARTSALHASRIERYVERGAPWARLHVRPLQRVSDTVVVRAEVVDERVVADSGGHREQRIVIVSTVSLGSEQWPIEITITNRDSMAFRMLLGRTAMRGHLMVDPARSFVMGKPPKRTKSSIGDHS